MLYINDEIKLKHIIHIHQLQNVYYDLTGDILKRPEPGQSIHEQDKPKQIISGFNPPRHGPGKYRNHSK